MLIRPALPTDALALARLGERLWRATYAGLIPASNLELHLAATFGPAQQAAELADPACRMLVLEAEGHLQGYALLRARRPEIETSLAFRAKMLLASGFSAPPPDFTHSSISATFDFQDRPTLCAGKPRPSIHR